VVAGHGERGKFSADYEQHRPHRDLDQVSREREEYRRDDDRHIGPEACASAADSYLVPNEIYRGCHGECVDEDRRPQGAAAHGQRDPDRDSVHALLPTVTVH
jgi:hypothetical protein